MEKRIKRKFKLCRTQKELTVVKNLKFHVGKLCLTETSSALLREKEEKPPSNIIISLNINKETSNVDRSVKSIYLDENNNKISKIAFNVETNSTHVKTQQQQPLQRKQNVKMNPFDTTMSDDDSNDCIFIDENDDSIHFVSETNCNIEISKDEKKRAKENSKHFLGVNGGKIQKRNNPCNNSRRFPLRIQEIFKNDWKTEDICRFAPTTSANSDLPPPFQLNDIKLNPLAVVNHVPIVPMSNETEENLFAEKPELFEKRMVIIDGSNVARSFVWPDQSFSVRGIEYCLEYFESRGFIAKVIIPQMRLKRHMSTDPDALDRLHRSDKIWLSPCKNLPGKWSTSYDDRFILEVAEKFDAAVVSNDSFRDLLGENPRWDEIINQRVITFMCCGGHIIFAKDPYGRDGKKLNNILHKLKKT